MSTPLHRKSSLDEIRRRFDADVDRFSDLESGQRATVDAPLSMELTTLAAAACNPGARTVLDIGCGAGNHTLKLLERLKPLDCDLVDLSRPMLERAEERIRAVNPGTIRTFCGDIREIELPDARYDIVIAAAVLHHLRGDDDWRATFRKIHRLTAAGGSVWITDLVAHETAPVQEILWQRYAAYLESIGGAEYQKKVFDYVDREDSPRSLTFQLDLLRESGFEHVEVLHKNSCFAAFGALKGDRS